MSLNFFFVILPLLRFNPFKFSLSFLFLVYCFICFVLYFVCSVICSVSPYVYYCFCILCTSIRTTVTGREPNCIKLILYRVYLLQATDITFMKAEDKIRVQQVENGGK